MFSQRHLRATRLNQYSYLPPAPIERIRKIVTEEKDEVISAALLVFFLGHIQTRRDPPFDRIDEVYSAHAEFSGIDPVIIDDAIELNTQYNTNFWKIAMRMREDMQMAYVNTHGNTQLHIILRYLIKFDGEKYPCIKSWDEIFKMYLQSIADAERSVDVTIVDVLKFMCRGDMGLWYAAKQGYKYFDGMDFRKLYLDELRELSDNDLRSSIGLFNLQMITDELKRRGNNAIRLSKREDIKRCSA